MPSVPLTIQNRCKIAIRAATQSTAAPLLFTVDGTALLSTTIGNRKLASKIWVYATDGNGQLKSQRVLAGQLSPGSETSQTWSAQLAVQADPGPNGKIVAEGENGYMIVRHTVPLPLGAAPTQVSIDYPSERQMLPGRFVVSGTIQGAELKEIPVWAVDAATNLLAAAVAPVQMIDSGAGRRGSWFVELNVERATTGEIRVGVPGTSVYTSRPVSFGGTGGNPSLPISAINAVFRGSPTDQAR